MQLQKASTVRRIIDERSRLFCISQRGEGSTTGHILGQRKYVACRNVTKNGSVAVRIFRRGKTFRLQERSDCPQGCAPRRHCFAIRCENAAAGGGLYWLQLISWGTFNGATKPKCLPPPSVHIHLAERRSRNIAPSVRTHFQISQCRLSGFGVALSTSVRIHEALSWVAAKAFSRPASYSFGISMACRAMCM